MSEIKLPELPQGYKDRPWDYGGAMFTESQMKSYATTAIKAGRQTRGGDQRAAFDAWYDSYDTRTPQSPFDREIARKAWDAALQSQDREGAEVARLQAVAQAVADALTMYERYGEVCPFEGEPMIHASTLVELGELARESIDHARRVEGEI